MPDLQFIHQPTICLFTEYITEGYFRCGLCFDTDHRVFTTRTEADMRTHLYRHHEFGSPPVVRRPWWKRWLCRGE